MYGTYPLNPPPKLHPPPLASHYHKLYPSSADSRRLHDSELPIQKLASLTVSHKSEGRGRRERGRRERGEEGEREGGKEEVEERREGGREGGLGEEREGGREG